MLQQQNRRSAQPNRESRWPLWDDINLLASVALLGVAVVLIMSLLAIYPVEPLAHHLDEGQAGLSSEE